MSNSQHRQKIYSINILQVVFYIDRFIVYKCYNKTCANSWTAPTHWILLSILHLVNVRTGADPGGGAPGARPPLELEKIRFFGVKSCFFTRNTPKMFTPPSARRNFLKCAPPLTWNPGSAPEDNYAICFISSLWLWSMLVSNFASFWLN
jgi:hypothetical protein